MIFIWYHDYLKSIYYFLIYTLFYTSWPSNHLHTRWTINTIAHPWGNNICGWTCGINKWIKQIRKHTWHVHQGFVYVPFKISQNSNGDALTFSKTIRRYIPWPHSPSTYSAVVKNSYMLVSTCHNETLHLLGGKSRLKCVKKGLLFLKIHVFSWRIWLLYV